MSTDMSTVSLHMLYITSCTDPLMWYSDRVGQFVPLLRRLPEGGWGSQEPDGHRNIVKRLDAEEVTASAPADKIGQWPYIQPANKLVHIVSRDVAERARKWPKQAEPRSGESVGWPPGGEPVDWPPGTGPQAQDGQCRDTCMLGACQKLSHCLEAKAHRLANLRKDIQAESDALRPDAPAATSQTRSLSAIEAGANIVIGFVVSVWITAMLLPAFGHQVTLSENVAMTCVFTVASFVRAYGIRRFFVWIEATQEKQT